MKKAFLFTLTAVLCANASFAQTRQRVALESATVFLSGAELFSTAKLSLPPGETEMLLTNVAGNVNPQTLVITATNGVVVQSAVFQNNYLNPADSTLSPRARALKDSIARIRTAVRDLSLRKGVVEEQLATIRENRNINGTNTGVNITELQKLLELINSRMMLLVTEQSKLEERITALQESERRFAGQLQEEQQKGYQPGGQLLVKFFTPNATATDLAMTYVVPNAGWTPSYDLRVESTAKPVRLFYKAQVFQNSGIDWKKVKLSLSSGNPGEGAEAPQLAPWYLAYSKSEYVQNQNLSTVTIRSNRYEKPLIGGGGESGSRNALTSPEIEKMPVRDIQQSSMNRFTSVDAAGIVTNFDIEIPYDVPSDGKQHNIGIKTYELPATYRYVAVPKLDKDAFLQAQITKWEDLNLLPAQTSIFFEGSYVGQGMIDPRNVRDTMNLSLGRDKRIVIRRERDKLYRSDKFIGTNIHEAFTYVTSIRNTKKEPVTVFITDQFPVSNDNDITIEDKEAEGARIEENTGLATWEVRLKPGETQKLRLAYTVKHPKGRVLSNTGR